MQLKLLPEPDLRDPGDPEGANRHRTLLFPRDLADAWTDPEEADRRFGREQARMMSLGCRYWLPDESELAARLGSRAPILLFVRGDLRNSAPRVAVVGTRRPDDYGLEMARCLGIALARAGVTVVSGGALGIDETVHRACIEAGGHTIVVLGSGLDRPHPARNQSLFARIASTGSCLVSEYAMATPALPRHFPERNRLVAGLSDAVVVVQAGRTSGALITADWARSMGIPLFAVPGDVCYASSAGCNELLNRGARVLGSPEDLRTVPVLRDIHPPWPSPGDRLRGLPKPWIGKGPECDPPEEALPLAGILGEGPATFDELVDRSGMPASRVQALLLAMEMAGASTRLPGGMYVGR